MSTISFECPEPKVTAECCIVRCKLPPTCYNCADFRWKLFRHKPIQTFLRWWFRNNPDWVFVAHHPSMEFGGNPVRVWTCARCGHVEFLK